MCSVLVQDPYFLTPEEISRLSPYQVRHIYFRPEQRDYYPGTGKPSPPYQETFRKVWLDRGKTPEEVDTLWQEQQSGKA